MKKQGSWMVGGMILGGLALGVARADAPVGVSGVLGQAPVAADPARQMGGFDADFLGYRTSGSSEFPSFPTFRYQGREQSYGMAFRTARHLRARRRDGDAGGSNLQYKGLYLSWALGSCGGGMKKKALQGAVVTDTEQAGSVQGYGDARALQDDILYRLENLQDRELVLRVRGARERTVRHIFVHEASVASGQWVAKFYDPSMAAAGRHENVMVFEEDDAGGIQLRVSAAWLAEVDGAPRPASPDQLVGMDADRVAMTTTRTAWFWGVGKGDAYRGGFTSEYDPAYTAGTTNFLGQECGQLAEGDLDDTFDGQCADDVLDLEFDAGDLAGSAD